MDPFSAEGELINLHNAFYQGQYSTVISSDISALSASNETPAKVFIYRARIATGEAEEVAAELDGDETPDFVAVKALALYKSGDEENGLNDAEECAAAYADNTTVQVVAGSVLYSAGKVEEALALLGGHTGNLEAVALIVQIRLAQNRTDLALKEVQAAKMWAQDSLVVNLAEAWVGLRTGGEKYQQSYYVFEELAQAPSTSSSRTLIGQAVSEIHLGRLPEAEVALTQALEKTPDEPTALANLLVLSVLNGQDVKEKLSQLEQVAPTHPLIVDLEAKSESFDKAAAKYAAKVKA